jgi:uncharacterized RDD family membrane protein YckC
MGGFAPASTGPVTGPQLDNRRVLAALVDIALLVPVALLMSALFGGFTDAAAALTMGWALYYYFALESNHGQTIGKRVMKIRVARADGSPLDTGRVAVRTLLRPIDAIGAYFVGLIVMLATGSRRQRLGDLAAGTVVTEAEATAPEAPVPAVEPEVRPFEPFSEPEPQPELEPEPLPEPPAHEIVPVEPTVEPEDAPEPTDHPVPIPEEPEQPSRLEIVSSPIDLVMEDHDEKAEDPEDPQQPPA